MIDDVIDLVTSDDENPPAIPDVLGLFSPGSPAPPDDASKIRELEYALLHSSFLSVYGAGVDHLRLLMDIACFGASNVLASNACDELLECDAWRPSATDFWERLQRCRNVLMYISRLLSLLQRACNSSSRSSLAPSVDAERLIEALFAMAERADVVSSCSQLAGAAAACIDAFGLPDDASERVAVAVASRKAPRLVASVAAHLAASNIAVATDVYEFVVMNDGPALELRRRIAARVVARLVGPPTHRACRCESGDVRVQELMTALGDCNDAATVVAAVWPRRLLVPLLGAAMTVMWPLALEVADDMALADVSWFATWVSRAECAMRRAHAGSPMSASAEFAMTAKLSCQLALAMNGEVGRL
jgi:hypothetical protein